MERTFNVESGAVLTKMSLLGGRSPRPAEAGSPILARFHSRLLGYDDPTKIPSPVLLVPSGNRPSVSTQLRNSEALQWETSSTGQSRGRPVLRLKARHVRRLGYYRLPVPAPCSW